MMGKVSAAETSGTFLDFTDPEATIVCPYNIAHVQLAKRVTAHLLKCRKQNPCKQSDYMTCKFDKNHAVPKREIVFHHQYCKSRYNVESACIVENSNNNNPARKGFVILAAEVAKIDVPCEEDWDNVPLQFSGLNIVESIKEQAAQKPIRRINDSVASKGERKTFIAEERARIQNIRKTDPTNVQGVQPPLSTYRTPLSQIDECGSVVSASTADSIGSVRSFGRGRRAPKDPKAKQTFR